ATVKTSRPSFRRWAEASSSSPCLRAVIASFAPSSPTASAICKPSPREPPVINATLPERSNSCFKPMTFSLAGALIQRPHWLKSGEHDRSETNMEKIWTKHWPSSVDEAAIRFAEQPLSALLSLQAQRVPDRPALIFYGRELSFRELDAAVSRFTGWLLERGIQPGDRVALFLENSPQFAIAYYGALRAGAIAVCLNPMHKAAELLHEFSDSGARVLVTSHRGYAT